MNDFVIVIQLPGCYTSIKWFLFIMWCKTISYWDARRPDMTRTSARMTDYTRKGCVLGHIDIGNNW